jgi:hypothetical protein
MTWARTLAALRRSAGWVNAFGPAFESLRADTLNRVLKTAASHGFWEIAPRDSLNDRWVYSWKRWSIFREKTLRSPER